MGRSKSVSRVPGAPYRYVQHALEGAADEVWAAMQSDAVVYVCGNASTMAPGVRAALVAVFRAKTGAGAADVLKLRLIKLSGSTLSEI